MSADSAIIEILAIKLYEHDSQDGMWPPKEGARLNTWMKLDNEDREIYRAMARNAPMNIPKGEDWDNE